MALVKREPSPTRALCGELSIVSTDIARPLMTGSCSFAHSGWADEPMLTSGDVSHALVFLS